MGYIVCQRGQRAAGDSAVFQRALQDLIRDQLWQALNVSQRNLDLIQELKGSQ